MESIHVSNSYIGLLIDIVYKETFSLILSNRSEYPDTGREYQRVNTKIMLYEFFMGIVRDQESLNHSALGKMLLLLTSLAGSSRRNR